MSNAILFPSREVPVILECDVLVFMVPDPIAGTVICL
jgi:hypothetical protein